VNFDAQDGRPLSQKALLVGNLLDRLQDRNAGTRMVILDASRPIPDLAEGLSSLTPFNKTLIASSAMPNQTTVDPPGRVANLFAKALAKALKEHGSTPQRVLENAQDEVTKASDHKQSPVLASMAVEPFYFVDPLPDRVVEVEKKVQAGDKKQNPKDELLYSWIPPGKFKMGCIPGDKDCLKDEFPQHEVQITKGFWMTSTEVTFLSYQKFAERTSHEPPQKTKVNDNGRRTDVPVTNITWTDAADYCKWAGGRLPTEAQWEYAARGGKADQKYPWGDKFDPKKANSFDSDRKKFFELVPVTLFGSGNGFNLHDMVGNASEWVSDFYDAAYFAAPGSAVDPQGPPAAVERVERVVKGGAFNGAAKHLRLSVREHKNPAKAENTTGFRCVVPSLQ
jgi:formylglycine-generating enzyme required for sulfatase activity